MSSFHRQNNNIISTVITAGIQYTREEREGGRETIRQRDRKIETERQTETEKQTETERQRERERERERGERDRETERRGGEIHQCSYSCIIIIDLLLWRMRI